jgi:hypothetical protein
MRTIQETGFEIVEVSIENQLEQRTESPYHLEIVCYAT